MPLRPRIEPGHGSVRIGVMLQADPAAVDAVSLDNGDGNATAPSADEDSTGRRAGAGALEVGKGEGSVLGGVEVQPAMTIPIVIPTIPYTTTNPSTLSKARTSDLPLSKKRALHCVTTTLVVGTLNTP